MRARRRCAPGSGLRFLLNRRILDRRYAGRVRLDAHSRKLSVGKGTCRRADARVSTRHCDAEKSQGGNHGSHHTSQTSETVGRRRRRGANRRPCRHPGERAGTGLRAGNHRPLAALGRLRAGFRRAAQRSHHAGMPEGDRHHAQGRNHQRQRPAGAHNLGDPVGNRTGYHHDPWDLAAALRREPCGCRRRGRGNRQRPGRLL